LVFFVPQPTAASKRHPGPYFMQRVPLLPMRFFFAPRGHAPERDAFTSRGAFRTLRMQTKPRPRPFVDFFFAPGAHLQAIGFSPWFSE
jgi:hypothetical protein